MDIASTVAVQPDGKILLAGTSSTFVANAMNTGVNQLSYSFIMRLNPGGTLDSTFGNKGQMVVPLEAGVAVVSDTYAMTLQPNGRILLGGDEMAAFPVDYGPDIGDVAIERFMPDGALDTTFGTGGYVHVAYGGASSRTTCAYAIAMTPNQRILSAGTTDADAGGVREFSCRRVLR